MIFREGKYCPVIVSLLSFLTLSLACPGVEIVKRAQWEARPAVRRPFKISPVHHVIIAHTVTAECLSKGACGSQMRAMQNYHIKLGWGDIGFNFAIGGDGRVYEGVGWTTEGVHTKGWNAKSYGIAFIGNYGSATPNDKMLKAARALIVCGIKTGQIAQSRRIHGARDATCTVSPGDKLYEIIKTWPMFEGGRLQGYSC